MRWLALLGPALALVLASQLASAEPNAVRYTIRRGDTLSSIAKRFGVSVASICRWNAIDKKAMLTPGRKLGVPLPPGRSPAAERAASGGAAKSWRELARAPERPGFVSLRSYTGAWQGQAVGENGKLSAAAAQGLSALLSPQKSAEPAEIDRRLLELVVRVSDTFGGRRIHVVSGYRPGRRSRHAHGQAVDFRVEGVPNWALRDYLRTLPNVGVGYYPNSTFVHLDVRERSTYWVDVSRPGQRPRYVKQKRTARR